MAETRTGKSATATAAGPYTDAMKRGLAFTAILTVVMLALFYESAASMVRVWLSSATFGHGVLIPPIVAYLFWTKRAALSGPEPRPSFWGVAWVTGAALLLLVGRVAQANLLQHLGLVGLVQGSVLAILGPRVTWRLAFPLGYMLFMVPFGEFAIKPLQDFTAQHTTTLVRWSGIPVLHENWMITIPGGSFLVAEACAGVRFLIASIALGVLIAGLFFRAWWKRLLFVALSIIVPIGANVVRAYGIVVIAHLSDFELAVGVDHLVYGFIFLSFVMGILIAIAFFMRDAGASAWQPALSSASPSPRPPAASARGLRAVAVPVLALAVAGAARAYEAKISVPSPAEIAALRAPLLGAEWTAIAAPAPETAWRGRYPHADAQKLWRFRSAGGDTLSLYIAYYADEGPGKELISGANRLTPSDAVDILEAGRLERWTAGGLPPPAYRILGGPAGRRVVWFWYCVDGEVVSDPMMAKALALRGKLLGGAARSAVVAISTQADSPRDTGLAERFLRASDLAARMRDDGPRRLVSRRETGASEESP